jgi:hypothetical protein
MRAAVFLWAMSVATAAAPQDRLVSARASSQPAGRLASTVRSLEAAAAGPEWTGYAVPGVAGHQSCRGDCLGGGRWASVGRLEDGHGASFESPDEAASAGGST